MSRGARLAAALAVALASGLRVDGRALLSRDEALALAFPKGSSVVRRDHVLGREQLDRASKLAGAPVETEIWTEYQGTSGDAPAGSAYFESHLVRTLSETLLVVVGPDSAVTRVEVVSFSEPPDYLPRRPWFDQFSGKHLDDDLAARRAIRGVTGATLTVRAATLAVRRVLAVHAVLHPPAPPAPAPSPGSSRGRP